MLKKLFKRRQPIVVYKDGKAHRVKTMHEAYALMTH